MDMNLSKLQEIVKDSEAWHSAVHEVSKSWTRLNNWTTMTKESIKSTMEENIEFNFMWLEGLMEKAMATHSSTLAWKIPWAEELGRLQSMGSRRVGQDWATFSFHFHALEKEMATHSSVLAWRIPGMGEPGGLPSMGSHRVGHDWCDLAAAACPSLTQTAMCLKMLRKHETA